MGLTVWGKASKENPHNGVAVKKLNLSYHNKGPRVIGGVGGGI